MCVCTGHSGAVSCHLHNLCSNHFSSHFISFFFFNDTATTEIYTLSLHDALPICQAREDHQAHHHAEAGRRDPHQGRSEEHTSELQSHVNLVCRLLLEKKKKKINSKKDNNITDTTHA